MFSLGIEQKETPMTTTEPPSLATASPPDESDQRHEGATSATPRAVQQHPLIVDHLTKRYGDHTVVDDLSFVVKPGRVTGFLGPNGSGKSTTMKMMLDLATADRGHATIGGQRYRNLSDPARTGAHTWEESALAPDWTDGIPIWTGDQVLWWQPGREHATAYDPESDRWWHISAPTFDLSPDDHVTLWAAAWTGTHAVATDGSRLYTWVPNVAHEIELDRSDHPRTDQPLAPGVAAGTRTGRLGLLGQACGFSGRNTVNATVTEDNAFSLDYVIDREEPCGSVIVHEGTATGSIDIDSRRFDGSGQGTVDGRSVVVTCECEITADNRVVGELAIDGVPHFIVAFVDG